MPEAATRDASWYSHPEVTYRKAVHVDNGDGFPLCNTHAFLVESPRWHDPPDVPLFVRCRRPACAKAYAEASV